MPPDNAGYYHAAYAAAVAIYALYAMSLWRRRARVRAALQRTAREATSGPAAGHDPV
jgi:heme exporter protein D